MINSPAAATAGSAFTFTVTAQDQFNNTVSSYGGTVTFTSSDSGVSTALPANSTLVGGIGVFSAALTTGGSQTLAVTDPNTTGNTGTIKGTSPVIAVGGTAASYITFSAPRTATAGSAFTFTVTAEDRFNNTANGYSGTVAFSSSDSRIGLSANVTLTSGIGVFAAILKTAGSQSLTATATVAGSITAASTTIAVVAAPVADFAVSAPVQTTAGIGFNFTVVALDLYCNTVASYTGTVHFTSTDGGASSSLPSASTLAGGVGTFSARLTTAGNQTVTATDTANSIAGTSGTIAVNVAAISHFAVAAPATTTAGTILVFGVTALDAFNNTITGYGGTVKLSSSDTAATLIAATATLTQGTGSFAAILRTAGNQTLVATDSVAASITGSKTIAVDAAPAARFFVSAPPAVTAGQVLFTVTAQDQFGNPATDYSGTVKFTSGDTAATLPPASTLVNGAHFHRHAPDNGKADANSHRHTIEQCHRDQWHDCGQPRGRHTFRRQCHPERHYGRQFRHHHGARRGSVQQYRHRLHRHSQVDQHRQWPFHLVAWQRSAHQWRRHFQRYLDDLGQPNPDSHR